MVASSQRSLARVRLIFWLIVGVLSLLSLQLVRLQALKANAATDPTRQTATGSLSAPRRGTIVDRNGDLLATDGVRYQISAFPAVLTETAVISIAQRLAPLVQVPQPDLEARMRDRQTNAVVLKFFAPKVAAQAVESWKTPGLQIDRLPRRFYPENMDGAFVLGFATIDQKGSYGVEAKYDEFLREDGNMVVTNLDRQAVALPPDFSLYLPSPVGRDLVLTIDRRIQALVDEELTQAVAYYGATGGTIIVMDPQTGGILASASSPGYSPNTFYDLDVPKDQPDPFADPAISRTYEPGSVFKIVTMAAGIDSGTITPQSTFRDDGMLEVGERKILNSDRQAHGVVDIRTILEKSLNIGSAQVALAMKADLFYSYVERFGFGNYTGVDLSGETRGIVKKPGESEWSQSDLATNAFGQGIGVTPLQMICAVSAVANRGIMMRPHVAKAIVDHGRWVEIRPSLYRTVISPQSAAEMTNLLVDVVDTGGLTQAAIKGYSIAGKTGTAEIPTKEGYDSDLTISTFVGYAPAENPRFVILVKLDKTRLSVWANHTSAPTFQRIARRLFALLNIPPDRAT